MQLREIFSVTGLFHTCSEQLRSSLSVLAAPFHRARIHVGAHSQSEHGRAEETSGCKLSGSSQESCFSVSVSQKHRVRLTVVSYLFAHELRSILIIL